MYEEQQRTKRLFGSDNTMGLFVALYLILLAFFILLNAVSDQAVVKAEAAMNSVNDTFKNARNTDNRYTDAPDAVDEPANDIVLRQVKQSFLSEMELPGRFSSSGGKIFEVQFPAERLFQRGSFQIRPNMTGFLDQLIRHVLTAPDRNAQKIAFMFGSGAGAVDRELTRAQEIAVRRAGSLARYLRDKGIPDGTFTIGFVTIPEGDMLAAFLSES